MCQRHSVVGFLFQLLSRWSLSSVREQSITVSWWVMMGNKKNILSILVVALLTWPAQSQNFMWRLRHQPLLEFEAGVDVPSLQVYCKWSGGLIREGLLTLTCFPGPQITTRVTTQASTSSSLPQTKPARTTTPPDDSSEEDATPPLPPAAAFSLQSQGEKGPARPAPMGMN